MFRYTWIVMSLVLPSILILLFGCQPIQPLTAKVEPLTPEEAVLGAAVGWNENVEEVPVSMVDASLAHFADNAVYELVGLPTGTETYTGHDEIYAWMAGLLENGFRYTTEILESDGNTVLTETKTWMDWSREAGIAPLVATEVYVVQDGKITHVTWTLSEESLAKVMTIMGGG